MGTLVKVTELVTTYTAGRWVRHRASCITGFGVDQELPDTRFSGAIFNYPENIEGRAAGADATKWWRRCGSCTGFWRSHEDFS